MKNAIRNAVVLTLNLPIIALIHAQSAFRGKKTAIRAAGPILTAAAKRALRYWVPAIAHPSEFGEFKTRMKSNFRLWSVLYDIEIAEDTPDTFKINVMNCPFCAVFAFVGLKDLNRYFCKADWEIAEDNKGKWIFERKCTIESGDGVCDHTYKRIPPGGYAVAGRQGVQ